MQNFNPRSREGSDRRHGAGAAAEYPISIHAPAKGATLGHRDAGARARHFNPRSREGSDLVPVSRTVIFVPFQSTLPRRERQGRLRRPAYPATISIHAPAKGATIMALIGSGVIKISIHAPAKGATQFAAEAANVDKISIHAPAKGATAKITKTIPNDFCKINNYNNSFA